MVDINHPDLINFIKKNRKEYYIFTGGGILKNEIWHIFQKVLKILTIPFYFVKLI